MKQSTWDQKMQQLRLEIVSKSRYKITLELDQETALDYLT